MLNFNMSGNSHDISIIFERSPVSKNDLADGKVRDINEKKLVPDLSVTTDIVSENRNAFFPNVEKNTISAVPLQQEIRLPPSTSNKCILPSVTPKNQFDFEIPCHCLKNQVLHKAHYSSSRCDSTQQYKCYFDSESSFHNGTKSPKQVTDKISFTNLGADLLEKRDYSTFSDDILRHFRQQDKKLDDLQSQISMFLQNKNSSDHIQNFIEYDKEESESSSKTLNSECYSKNKSAQNSNKIKELDQNFILMYIKEHSDQISKLQDQIDHLLKRTEKLEYLYSMKEEAVCNNEGMLNSSNGNNQFSANEEASSIPVDKRYEPSQKGMVCHNNAVACNNKGMLNSNDNYQFSENDEASSNPVDKRCEPSLNGMVCHREKQVKKTSSSTMTSLTFEGSDKLVFRKMLTVVTDVSKCQRDVSIQCPQGIDTTASETSPKTVKIDSRSAKNERQITPKSTDSKKKKKCLKSPKKSVNRNEKSNQKQVYQTTPAITSPADAYSSPQFQTINPDCANQSSDSDRENRLATNILSPKEKILFESISRNIDHLIGTQDEDFYSPSKNSNEFPKYKSKLEKDSKTKHTPRTVLSSTERNKICLKSSSRSSSASSNTSEDFVYTSPKERDKVLQLKFNTSHSPRNTLAVSKYGMSSPNLSVVTKTYIEKYGLFDQSSPEDKTKKTFTRNHRTLECRRQLR